MKRHGMRSRVKELWGWEEVDERRDIRKFWRVWALKQREPPLLVWSWPHFLLQDKKSEEICRRVLRGSGEGQIVCSASPWGNTTADAVRQWHVSAHLREMLRQMFTVAVLSAADADDDVSLLYFSQIWTWTFPPQKKFNSLKAPPKSPAGAFVAITREPVHFVANSEMFHSESSKPPWFRVQSAAFNGITLMAGVS